MDNQYTFLELPLDRDLYTPKKISKSLKPPMRVLITEAGTKVARNLMYKICRGTVFGRDQPIILHLVNARGSVDHKATMLDLEECGFPMLEDSVVVADAEKSYSNVDFVVLIALFEELSGHNVYNSFLSQLNKTRTVVQNLVMYSKPDTKLVVCSPSTKGALILLACIKAFEPALPIENISSVVFMDVTISKALLAAQLKTTTDKIKNLVIWGGTCPDIHNATVNMYPPDDRANIETKDIPVMKVLQNQKWIYTDFIPKVYKRVLGTELVKHGTAVAAATAKHLSTLYYGTDSIPEVVSMGVVVPPHEPYGTLKFTGLALPVKTTKGAISIRQDVESAITTQLMLMRSVYNYKNDVSVREVYKVIKYIKEYEDNTKKQFLWSQHTYLTERGHFTAPFMKFIISPRHDESLTMDEKEVTSKKSITWDEVNVVQSTNNKNVKSVLRFNLGRQNST